MTPPGVHALPHTPFTPTAVPSYDPGRAATRVQADYQRVLALDPPDEPFQRHATTIHAGAESARHDATGVTAGTDQQSFPDYASIGMPESTSDGTLFAAGVMLAHDALAGEVCDALGEAGVRALLLKGSSTVGWLYGNRSARYSMDVDLLVAPGDVPAAERALTARTFSPLEGAREERHARAWVRSEPRAAVDLHRSLVGVGVAPDEAWRILSTRTESTADGRVEMLASPARLVLLALHAAQHGLDGGQPLADLERALAVAPTPLWDDAARLAQQLDAVPAFGAGLRLTPRGRAEAERLGLPERMTTEVALRAGVPPDAALTLARIVETHGVRAKVAFACRRGFPGPADMRWRYALARRGSLGLAAAYARRAVWLVVSLPAAVRAVAKARRDAAAK